MHPSNLALRFLLESVSLATLGWWGYVGASGPVRWLWALGLPTLAAAAWGVFAVPGDPSRGGQGVVAVPGALRLVLELSVLGIPAWGLAHHGHPQLGTALGVAVFAHYAFSYRRIFWLLRGRKR